MRPIPRPTHPTSRQLTSVALGAALVVLASTSALSVTPAVAVSSDLVISEVYGGGGNSGSTYTHDFIEIANRGSAALAVSGWSVQYASSQGTTWSRTNLTGTVPAGGRYLVRLATGGGGTTALPTPDATGTTNVSATSGKVALVQSTTNLTCGNNCDRATGVKDFLGYGSANDSEGSPAAGGSNTTSVQRTAAADTDSNAADFATGAPTPTNTAGGGGGPTGPRIRDVQGTAHISPRNGQRVSAIPGVVVARGTKGFWIQDAQPDTDPATSEGLYVYTSTAPTAAVGDSVTVTGTVTEFRPGGTSGTDNLTITELTSPTVTKLSSGNALPAATPIGSGGRVPPSAVIDDDATGNVETSGTFDATTDGIDFWESVEGMRISVTNAAVVGRTNSYGEVTVVPAGSGTRTARGGILAQTSDHNPERLVLDDILSAAPTANVGDTLAGTVTGVVDYSFGNFKLYPATTPGVTAGNLAKEVTVAPAADQLAVATFNVENLDPGDPQATFDGLAAQVVTNLRSPDVVLLEEVQDNDGAVSSGTVAANQTMAKLSSAIAAAGGPSYQYRQIDPEDGMDGGEPGGNIRQVFLFRSDRGLSFVDRPGATATTANSAVGSAGAPQLRYSPGRIDPGSSAWNSSRKPLAAEFRWNGSTLFVIGNHFNSKGGDDPLFGKVQPPQRSSETQRHQQADLVRAFVNQIQAVDAAAKVVVLGDINDFEYSVTTDKLVGTGAGAMVSLPRELPLAERYSYVYEGNSQVLDQILVTQPLANREYDIVHVNAEFASQLSDHDPSVVRLRF